MMPMDLLQIERVDGHVADVGDGQAVERRGAGRHVVGPDEAALGADLARAEAGAGAVRGAGVQRHADEADVQVLGARAASAGASSSPVRRSAASGCRRAAGEGSWAFCALPLESLRASLPLPRRALPREGAVTVYTEGTGELPALVVSAGGVRSAETTRARSRDWDRPRGGRHTACPSRSARCTKSLQQSGSECR